MEQENDKFAVEIHVHKKSAFMMLSFEDRGTISKKKNILSWGCQRKKNEISED